MWSPYQLVLFWVQLLLLFLFVAVRGWLGEFLLCLGLIDIFILLAPRPNQLWLENVDPAIPSVQVRIFALVWNFLLLYFVQRKKNRKKKNVSWMFLTYVEKKQNQQQIKLIASV